MANYYRVANGNWNDSNSWAGTSGGTDYKAAPPSSTDNVYFDANTPNGTHTVNVTSYCLTLNFTGFTGTFAGASSINPYGNITIVSGMTYTHTGDINMRGDITLISAGKQLPLVRFATSSITLTLGDDLTCKAMGGNTATLVTGGYSLTMTGVNNAITFPSVSGSFSSMSITNTAVITAIISFTSNFTVSGNLTINGDSTKNRMFLKTNLIGTTYTITCNGTLTSNNCDYQDIVGAGSCSWDLSSATGGSGDCRGNSGITFTTATTTECTAGTTRSTATWSVRIPLPQDTATFSGSSRTISLDMARIGNVNFTGSSGLTWSTPNAGSVFGNINLTDLATLTNNSSTFTFYGRASQTMICAGKSRNKTMLITVTGTFTAKDDFLITNSCYLYLSSGEFSLVDGTTNSNFTGGYIYTNPGTTLTLGSGTVELTGNANTTIHYNTTVTATTGLIKMTGTLTANKKFEGGGHTYNNFENATSGNYAISVTASVGSNTFNNFKVNAGRIQKFGYGNTTTVTTFEAIGTSGSGITLTSDFTSTTTLVKDGGGTIECQYCTVSYITGSPDNTWYMDSNSVDGGNNSQIYFNTATATGNMFLMF